MGNVKNVHQRTVNRDGDTVTRCEIEAEGQTTGGTITEHIVFGETHAEYDACSGRYLIKDSLGRIVGYSDRL